MGFQSFGFPPNQVLRNGSWVEIIERTGYERKGEKKAPIVGRFTPVIISVIKQTLETDYNFDPTKITINTTTTQTFRQQYLTASIEVPR